MPGVSPYSPKGYDANNGSPKDWYVVRGYLTNGGAPQLAKKVHIRNTANNAWIEVWNARPTVVVSTVTSATYSVSASQITVSGTVEAQGLATSLVFYYRASGTTAYYSITGSLTATLGAQNYSFNPTDLDESTTWEYIVQAINTGGTTSVTGTKATPVNCTTGNSGFSLLSETNTAVACGTCGTFNRNVKTYSKTNCSNYSVTTDGSCTEATCGCATASTNGWSTTQTRNRLVYCSGTCNGQDQYQEYITKSGCTEVITKDWTNTGGCTDRFAVQDANNYSVGWSMWMERLGYGNLDNRFIKVRDSLRTYGNPYDNVFGDNDVFYACGTPYGITYRVVYCPITGAFYWTNFSCTQDYPD